MRHRTGLRLIAITLGGIRWEKCLATYPDAVPFAATPSLPRNPEAKRLAIADTYYRLKLSALAEGWDGILVIQDDVRFRGPIPDGYGVFGRNRGRGHWCPQAFRFDLETWRRVGWDGESQVCRAWAPLIDGLPKFDLASDRLDVLPLADKPGWSGRRRLIG